MTAHRCMTIKNPTAYDGYTAVCSCGWRSEEMATYRDAARVWNEHARPEPVVRDPESWQAVADAGRRAS